MSKKNDKVIVVAPKESKNENLDDRYLDVDEDFSSEDFDWIQEKTEQVVISRALARAILKRRNCMRIIQLMVKNRTALQQKEIRERLNLSWKLAQHNLAKLITVGIVKDMPVTALDKQSKYYELADEELGKNLVKSFHGLVSLRLAKTFEYGKTYYVSDLQNDVDFLRLCRRYDWSFDESIENLRDSKKVEVILNYDKKLIAFKRK